MVCWRSGRLTCGMYSWFSRVLVTGLVVAATVGGAALPASAEPYPTHDVSGSASTEPADDQPVAVQDLLAAGGTSNVRGKGVTLEAQSEPWIAGATFHPSEEIGLGPGKIIENNGTVSFDLLNGLYRTPHSMVAKWANNAEYVSAIAAYPIVWARDGAETGYWIQSRISTRKYAWAAYGECQVFNREPGTDGAKPVWNSPFACDSVKYTNGANDFDVNVYFQI